MNINEIIGRLNTIALEEIKENYNKSESKRIFDACCGESKSQKLAKEFEKELNKSVIEGYKVSVSQFGMMIFYKKLSENMFQEVKKIDCQASKYIPYGYVMGKKISKSAMEKIVKEIAVHCVLN